MGCTLLTIHTHKDMVQLVRGKGHVLGGVQRKGKGMLVNREVSYTCHAKSMSGVQADAAAAREERLQVPVSQSFGGRPPADPGGIWPPDTPRRRQPACPQR